MKEESLKQLLECAVAAAEAGGRHALDHFDRRTEVDRRAAHDVKLRLDVESQQAAESVIRRRFPAHAVLGEEGAHDASGEGYRWIIDPIDGTVNFSHGLPVWCCSVAVQHRGRMRAGAVRLPMLGELYTATADGPAECNGRPIRVSDTARMEEAVLYTGILETAADDGISLRAINRLAPRVQKIRVLGSAAVELCYIAAGRGDAYMETRINLWDLAAGWLLIERAGGRCEVLEHLTPVTMRFCASNGRIHAPLRAALTEAMAGSR